LSLAAALPLPLLLQLRRATADPDEYSAPSLVVVERRLRRPRGSPPAADATAVTATPSPSASIGRLLDRRRMLADRDDRTEHAPHNNTPPCIG